MSEGRDVIIRALTEAASKYGFKGVGGTNYYREYPETICLLNLQRSSWGPQFYVNAAVWFTRFGAERRPKEHRCHIRWRVNSLMADDEAKLFTNALDVEHLLTDDQRISRIKNGIEAFGLDRLVKCESETSALKIADEAGPYIMVLLQAREKTEAI